MKVFKHVKAMDCIQQSHALGFVERSRAGRRITFQSIGSDLFLLCMEVVGTESVQFVFSSQ